MKYTICFSAVKPVLVSVCVSHLVLRGTYSGRPFPAPQPVLGQQESALLPTSAPAAETDLPYVCLKTVNSQLELDNIPFGAGGENSAWMSSYLLPHLRFWAAHGAGKLVALFC